MLFRSGYCSVYGLGGAAPGGKFGNGWFPLPYIDEREYLFAGGCWDDGLLACGRLTRRTPPSGPGTGPLSAKLTPRDRARASAACSCREGGGVTDTDAAGCKGADCEEGEAWYAW